MTTLSAAPSGRLFPSIWKLIRLRLLTHLECVQACQDPPEGPHHPRQYLVCSALPGSSSS